MTDANLNSQFSKESQFTLSRVVVALLRQYGLLISVLIVSVHNLLESLCGKGKE